LKILCLHSDYIRVRPTKKAIKTAESIDKEPIESKETLVVFTAVEKRDENKSKTIEKCIDEIESVYNQVKAKEILIYPYVHLTKNPGSPDLARDILDGVFTKLSKKYHVKKAPFGWYKTFEISVKGHPLAELSREIFEGGEEEKVDYKKLLNDISKTTLDREKLKENDHRILGREMDLFSFNEMAPGMAFWHDKGLIIYNELINLWRKEHRKAGYKEISTPQIMDKRLWQISGHWDKYKENNFLTEYENRTFLIKPMNCPGGILVYKNTPKSYKDLPLRVGEMGIVHRNELSGVLSGLFRAIKFTQDDAHIYCREDQVEDEIVSIIKMIDKFYKKIFSFDYKVELSTRPEKRIGSDELWDESEKILKKVLKSQNIKYKTNEGDGAFYGPKIDFHIKDSLGRTWQCATVQLDFSMPERFDLKYKGEDNKDHRPIMIHRTVYGSLERFIGILLEHTNGRLPTWLAPVQVRILSFTNRNKKSAEKLFEKLSKEELRVELDVEESPIEGKVRNAEMQKIPYIVVIGDKEEKSKTIAVRHNGKLKYGVDEKDFIKSLKKEIEELK